MGILTLAGFRTELLVALENRGDAVVSDANGVLRLNRWVNWSYVHCAHPDVFMHREVQTRHDLTLVLNTFSYSISEATLALKILRIQQATYVAAPAFDFVSRRVDVRPESITQYQGRTPRTGPNPNTYAVRGENLNIHPGPDASAAGNILSLEVIREPQQLVADADTTVLPNYWDEVVFLGALWRAQRDLGYQELSEQTKQNFAALINETGGHTMFATLDTRQSAGPGIETGGPGYSRSIQ